MISKSEKKRIKKIIGHRYVGPIQTELNERNEFNKQGETYSSGHITNVMNGEPHGIIEAAIFSVVQKSIAEKEELAKQRQALLNT